MFLCHFNTKLDWEETEKVRPHRVMNGGAILADEQPVKIKSFHGKNQ